MGHLIFLILMKFQSTLPRRERLLSNVEIKAAINISIHAPAKGATRIRRSTDGMERNFNPRSREGSDELLGVCRTQGENFNPRSREGSDQIP